MQYDSILLLSDFHIGLSPKEPKRARLIINKIAESYPGIPVVITGDITDSAKQKEFKKARELVDQLAKTNPILMVPGNHDYAWKGNIFLPEAWKKWVKYLGSPLGWENQPVDYWLGVDFEPKGVDGLGIWKDEPYIYFGVDSGDPQNKQISARGYISKGLAKALHESLKKYKGKTRIVFLHHHPFDAHLFTALHGSKRLLTAVKDNCELLLFGHEHEYGIWWNKRGVPLIVSSHKSTQPITGNCLFITKIDVDNVGKPNVSFRHNLLIV